MAGHAGRGVVAWDGGGGASILPVATGHHRRTPWTPKVRDFSGIWVTGGGVGMPRRCQKICLWQPPNGGWRRRRWRWEGRHYYDTLPRDYERDDTQKRTPPVRLPSRSGRGRGCGGNNNMRAVSVIIPTIATLQCHTYAKSSTRTYRLHCNGDAHGYPMHCDSPKPNSTIK